MIYFALSFAFTFFSISGFKRLDLWWQKVMALIFYACICMMWFPMCMGKLLYKLYEKHT